jgi:hypothetical protein
MPIIKAGKQFRNKPLALAGKKHPDTNQTPLNWEIYSQTWL